MRAACGPLVRGPKSARAASAGRTDEGRLRTWFRGPKSARVSSACQIEQLLMGVIGDYQMEKRYRHREGRYVWVLLSVSLRPIRTDDSWPSPPQANPPQ